MKIPASKFFFIFLAITLFAQAPLQATADSASYSWWKIGTAVVATVAVAVGSYFGYKWHRIKTLTKTVKQEKTNNAPLEIDTNQQKLNTISLACEIIRNNNNEKIQPCPKKEAAIFESTQTQIKIIEDILKTLSDTSHYVNFNAATDKSYPQKVLVKVPLIIAAIASNNSIVLNAMIRAKVNIHASIDRFDLATLLTLDTYALLPPLHTEALAHFLTDGTFNDTNHGLLYYHLKNKYTLNPHHRDMDIGYLVRAGAKDPRNILDSSDRSSTKSELS